MKDFNSRFISSLALLLLIGVTVLALIGNPRLLPGDNGDGGNTLPITPEPTVPPCNVPAGFMMIRSASDLNSIRTNLSANFYLCADIDLTGQPFAPIGDISPEQPFLGVLDGAGHTIRGITIQPTPSDLANSINSEALGLFASIGEGATVKNLKLANATVRGNSDVGALAGRTFGATISGITLINTQIECTFSCGMLAGYARETTIEDVTAAGSVSYVENSAVISTGQIGGLVGLHYSYIYSPSHRISNVVVTGNIKGNFSTGGIVGEAHFSQISSAEFSGDIEELGANAGGIAGTFAGPVSGQPNSDQFARLVKSSSSGSVHGKLIGSNFYTGSDLGGLVGKAQGHILIVDNYSHSNVTAQSYAASLVAEADSASGEFKNSYGYGAVRSGEPTPQSDFQDTFAGVIAINWGEGGAPFSLSSLFYNRDLNPSFPDLRNEGRSDAALKQASTFGGWDIGAAGGSTTWVIEEGIAPPYLNDPSVPTPTPTTASTPTPLITVTPSRTPTRLPTVTRTPNPPVMCTAVPCASGSLVCPVGQSCQNGCGYVCMPNTPTPTATATGASQDTMPPALVVEAPQPNQVIVGVFRVKVTATDNVAVREVQIFKDRWDDAYRIATLTSAPYQFDWNTLAETEGVHTLGIRVYDSSNLRTDLAFDIRISKSPPQLSVIAPQPNQTISGVFNIQVAASDDVAVKEVQIFKDHWDNAYRIATLTSPPYQYNWNTLAEPDGVHTLGVRAYDSTDLRTDLAFDITIRNVSNTPTPTRTPTRTPTPNTRDLTPPQLNILAPNPNQVVSGIFRIKVAASDNVAVKEVQIFKDRWDNAYRMATLNSPPYEFDWNTAAEGEGIHTLGVRAYDTANLLTQVAFDVNIINSFAPPTDLCAAVSCDDGQLVCPSGSNCANGCGLICLRPTPTAVTVGLRPTNPTSAPKLSKQIQKKKVTKRKKK